MASVTVVTAAARRTTERAMCRSTPRLARTPARSYERWGCDSHGSRKSATHGVRVAVAIASPMRWAEFGGDVVRIASILRSRTILIPAGTAVAAQGSVLSGISARW